jgi:hypothetical protein
MNTGNHSIAGSRFKPGLRMFGKFWKKARIPFFWRRKTR